MATNPLVRLTDCGGACVREGQKHWQHLLSTFPERYAVAERQEQDLRDLLGDVAILKRRRGGAFSSLTLAQLRHETEAAGQL